MKTTLRRGQIVIARGMQASCVIKDYIAEGTQAEVYKGQIGALDYAVKWYKPGYADADPRLWQRLKDAVNRGFPTEKFLWPFDLLSMPKSTGFSGYVMPLKEPNFISLVDLVGPRPCCEPSFRALATVGFHVAHSFLKLHSSGFCYRDVNFGNLFFDPNTGDVRIGDTDNVDVDGRPGGILGTPGFMAPEVASRKVGPSSRSDRFSLAVLLFYIFMTGHPLMGKREEDLPYEPGDPHKTKRMYVDDPVFIFDPQNESNRPLSGQSRIANFWRIYPQSMRELFTTSFTRGLKDPDARVMDNDWRKEMCRLRDSIFVCSQCGEAELFFDLDYLKANGSLAPCWACAKIPSLPPRMRIGDSKNASFVMLSPGAQLFPHHLEGDPYNFFAPLAEVTNGDLGLKNLSGRKWTARVGEQPLAEVLPGSTLQLTSACRIHFGKTEADVRV